MSDDPFLTHRSLLFTVAYEMLGSAADAEDVVQETWMRWAKVDQAEVRDPRAYLVRIVTRQALDRLRTLARRREAYVGEWLPEPLRTSPDVAEDVELAESVSIAMLTVLETLGRVERAVFVLREVFDMPYDEIGGRRQERRRRAAGRPPRTGTRNRAQTAHVGEPRQAAEGGGAVPRRTHDRRPPEPARRTRARRGGGGRRRWRGPGSHSPGYRREDGGAPDVPVQR
jgi:RNA polymerase sigma-70 factor (ECF subfamily)